MEKNAQKVNAKMFLRDFRDGKSDEGLMRLHGLTRPKLDKLMRILLERKLLDPSELKPRTASPPPEKESTIPSNGPQYSPTADVAYVGIHREDAQKVGLSCPQCGARVSERMLSCPECGHILPGEDRWEAAEPGKGLLDRVSARTLGYIIAIPVGILLFFLFKNAILPMTQATMDKRAEDIRKEIPNGMTPKEAARDVARQAGARIIQIEVQRLVSNSVLSSANKDYTSFTAGSEWTDLPQEEKRHILEHLRSALVRSSMPGDFELVNDSGESLARVTDNSIEFTEGRDSEGSGGPGGELGGSGPAASIKRDILNRIPKYRGR
ncbi:MAG: zinc ribbon domain-containing protein [Desulfomonilaceae bacterium]